MADNGTKIITGLLVIAIIITVGVFVYYEWWPDGEDEEIMLTALYGGETWEYTLSDLIDIDDYRGSGGMSTQTGIRGSHDYTGVRFELLLQNIGISNASSVEAKVIAVDGYNQTFTSDILLGNVTIYDATGNETNGTVTLILAYEEDGVLISKDDGPLRLVFVADEPAYTTSKYWIKQVSSVDILAI